ncbi:MAG: aspartate aminotransferase family protein [Proteobacteria bacterium]|nr:aspartate aminotransferase family protein [Pseudomonadota bacterium]
MTQTTANDPTPRWRELDARHHMHPFTDSRALAGEGSRIVTRADGVHFWDSEGNRFLDGMAGLWNVNVGYGRASIADAVHRQLLELPFYNTFFKSATPPSVELSKILADLTPKGMDHVFYASSGSEANDTIVRMVRHYWNLKGRPEKKIFISREFAYHGSTMASASLGGMTAMHEQADLPLPGFVHVTPPYWYRYGGEMSPAEFGLAAARAVEEKILDLGAENIAAFIGEPVQGAGGVIVPPETYWPEIQRICRKHDVLLVTDEVICGFGRTGDWFGADTFGIEPDLMAIAKGLTSGYLPLSAVVLGERLTEELIDAGGEFNHGFTYSGHPACCAAAIENIRIMKDENLIERARESIGPYFQGRLRELADHPLVGEVRGIGMIAAVELSMDKATRRNFPNEGRVGIQCRDHCLSRGLMVRAVRDSLVLSPALVLTRSQADEIVEILRAALDSTLAERGDRA